VTGSTIRAREARGGPIALFTKIPPERSVMNEIFFHPTPYISHLAGNWDVSHPPGEMLKRKEVNQVMWLKAGESLTVPLSPAASGAAISSGGVVISGWLCDRTDRPSYGKWYCPFSW